jgi:hypothetical protein
MQYVVRRSRLRVAGELTREQIDRLLRQYEERRQAALRRIYGWRWLRVYTTETMLKEDDHGLSE